MVDAATQKRVEERVKELLMQKYPQGIETAIAADEAVVGRLLQDRKDCFAQAMGEQETDLSKALSAAKEAMAVLAAENAKVDRAASSIASARKAVKREGGAGRSK